MILDSDEHIRRLVERKRLRQVFASKLSRTAEHEAHCIGNRVLQRYNNHHRIPSIFEYPAAVSACCSPFRKDIYKDSSHGIRAKHIHKLLLRALRNLGQIGCKTNKCNNKLGHCAEQNAANKLLKDQSIRSLDDIYFGDAYRPRTGVVVPPCENCKEIFINVKER